MGIQGSESGRYLSFILGDETYAIPVEMVEVVLETPAVTRVPNATSHMRGVINYRGSVVPIVDPRIRFDGIPIALDDTTSVIVLQMKYEGEDVVVGMLADGVREVVEIPIECMERAPALGSQSSDKFIAGVAKLGEGFVVLLDVEAAFSKAGSAVVGGNS
jgi:purine-binding chemotaxis protein CheW